MRDLAITRRQAWTNSPDFARLLAAAHSGSPADALVDAFVAGMSQGVEIAAAWAKSQQQPQPVEERPHDTTLQ